MNLKSLFAAPDYSGFVTDVFPILQIVIISIIVLLSVLLIACILFQPSESSGMGAIAGQSTETFYSKNKGKSLQGMLKKLTVIFSISILVLTVAYLIIVVIFPVNI